MKRKLRILFFLLPLSVFVFTSTSGCTNEVTGGDDKSDPGTTEIQTEDSGLKGTNISESDDNTVSTKPDYNAMSTEELLAVCLESPYFPEFGEYTSYPQAIKVIKKRAKKFQILYDREDASEVLMKGIRDFGLTTEDQTEVGIGYESKETFMFGMLRCLYLDGRLTKEEFKEAEGLHFQRMNDIIAAEGGETVPYDPDVGVVYADEGGALTVDDLIVGSLKPENMDLTRHYMVSEPFSIRNSPIPDQVVYFVFCDGKCIGELTTRIIQSKYFGEASFYREKCDEITALYEAGTPISVMNFGEECWGIVSGEEELLFLYGSTQFDKNLTTVIDAEEEQIVLRDLKPTWMKFD